MDRKYAVLTGDIVKSRKLSPQQLESVRKRILWSVSVLNSRWRDVTVGNVDFYRGDGWQMLLQKPELALHAALMLRTSLIAFEDADTRVAIGFGPVEHINQKNISQSTGQAFELSGKLLDDMKMNQYLDLLVDIDSKHVFLYRISIHLCDALIRRLTSKQAEAVFWALQGHKQTEIAGEMNPPVKQPTAAEHLILAGWDEIEQLVSRKIDPII